MIAPASSTKHIQLYIREIVDGIWHDSVSTLQFTPFKWDGGSNVESVIVKGSVPVSGFEVVMTIARTRENFLGIFIAHKRAYH
jgi:hypothetical protein